MAAIQLTQVSLAIQRPFTDPPTMYVVQASESFVAINPLMLSAVGPTYQADGSTIDVRTVIVKGAIFPIYVTESYTYIKLYIDGL